MQRDDLLELIDDREFKGWALVKNIKTGRQGYVPVSYLDQVETFKNQPWFFENVTRNKGEELLRAAGNAPGKTTNTYAKYFLAYAKYFDILTTNNTDYCEGLYLFSRSIPDQKI